MHTMASGMNSSNSERGIRGLDHELNTCKEGSWAVSASATPATVAGFVRYSKDLKLPFQLPSEPSMPSTPSSARVEVELCSNTFQDRYLALRNLWSVGRFSRLGLEVGLSIHNLHLSVYWSRLGQRLSIPLLIAPQPLSSPSLLFWAGALPFAGLATLQLFLHHRRGRRSPTRSDRRVRRDLSPAAAQVAIARNRYEADSVTVLLAQPVEARQKRQMALGGLVILGAKYGVFNDEDGPGGDPVADVTIAIAALIDDSSANVGPGLVIPSSVRKSRIPGFWDPAPGKEKMLLVHYSYRGNEGTITVRGREELILPPPTTQS
jgi:DnaJ family protein C protein 11